MSYCCSFGKPLWLHAKAKLWEIYRHVLFEIRELIDLSGNRKVSSFDFISGKPLFSGESSIDQLNLILGSVAVTSLSWKAVAGAGCTDRTCCPEPSLYGTRDNGGHPDFPLRDALPQASLMGELFFFSDRLVLQRVALGFYCQQKYFVYFVKLSWIDPAVSHTHKKQDRNMQRWRCLISLPWMKFVK